MGTRSGAIALGADDGQQPMLNFLFIVDLATGLSAGANHAAASVAGAGASASALYRLSFAFAGNLADIHRQSILGTRMRRVEISNAASVVVEQASSNVLETLATVITAFAAVGTLFIAYRALETWRAQIKGQTRFELARKLMTAVNDMAQKFHAARSPVIIAHEFPEAYNARNARDISDHDRANATRDALWKRYKPVNDAGSVIVGLLPEVRTLFPEEIATATEAFLDPPWSLRAHMEVYVDQIRHGNVEAQLAQGDPEAMARLRGERREQHEAVFASPPRPGQPIQNPLTIELLGKHEALAVLLRPYLELSAK